jgi:hypothetical protein
MPVLPPEEYIEQAYLFKALTERVNPSDPVQVLLKSLKSEVLATTNLPKAISFILDELNHAGTMATAMRRLSHYFAPFQAYVVEEAENERGRFDSQTGFLILQHEAELRAQGVSPQALFFYQFETLCRNRLNYDRGLAAIAGDPLFDPAWSKWILGVRHKLGIVDIADLVYVHSEYYRRLLEKTEQPETEREIPRDVLFGEKEGRIALANRRSEPLYFFAALQRQLDYPPVPRPKRKDEAVEVIPTIQRTLERLELRIKLLEDEQREKGIDLSKFYQRPDMPWQPPADESGA